MITKLALTNDRWLVVGEQALLAALAGGLSYVVQHASGGDFGDYTALVVAASTVLLNYLKKVIDTPDAPAPDPTPVPTDGREFPIGGD